MDLVATKQTGKFWWSSKIFLATLLLICVVLLLPSVKVIADELGGLATEKLIGRSGVSPSELTIGGINKSLIDIVFGSAGGHINTSAPVTPIINVWLPTFVILAIYTLVRSFLGTVSIMELILAATFIYMLMALMPSLQGAINQLFIG